MAIRRSLTVTVGSLATIALAGTGVAAGSAPAAPHAAQHTTAAAAKEKPAAEGKSAAKKTYKVTSWAKNVNVRTKPKTSSQSVARMNAGSTGTASCWTTGDYAGQQHNHWVKLYVTRPGDGGQPQKIHGYVHAWFLKGDAYGNVPKSAKC